MDEEGVTAMGEIKSTLDLVMERTRHLSLSAEEKEEQRREEFEKRLQGLLQQYADEALPRDELRDRMAALGTEMDMAAPRRAAVAVLRRIDPDRENDRWLALLDDLAPDIGRPLEDILAAYQKDRAALLQAGQAQVRDRLARDHGITGSAVVPNPGQDRAVQGDLETLKRATEAKIEALKGAKKR